MAVFVCGVPDDRERHEVLQTARTILARMELLSYGSVSRMGGRRGAESPGSPQGEAHPLHEEWRERFAKAPDAEAARDLLELAEAELDAALRRRLVPEATETLDELCARIVSDGWGISSDECARAMRCTPTLVRRARLDADRHPETGGSLPERTGDPLAWSLALDAAGLSLRQIEALTGVPKSSLHRALSSAR